jgi:hypothetical protein
MNLEKIRESVMQSWQGTQHLKSRAAEGTIAWV